MPQTFISCSLTLVRSICDGVDFFEFSTGGASHGNNDLAETFIICSSEVVHHICDGVDVWAALGASPWEARGEVAERPKVSKDFILERLGPNLSKINSLETFGRSGGLPPGLPGGGPPGLQKSPRI